MASESSWTLRWQETTPVLTSGSAGLGKERKRGGGLRQQVPADGAQGHHGRWMVLWMESPRGLALMLQ